MECPRTIGLRILTRKWSYFLLRSLREPLGFSQMKRELKFATNHVLSKELKQLLAEELIIHRDDKYSLAPAGRTLLEAAEHLHHWSCKHKGLTHCPAELPCSKCTHYPSVVRR